MPPLDTGSTTHTLRLVDPLNNRAEPAPGDFPTVGLYLRAVRERRGKALADLVTVTRVRRSYLEAIETSDYAALPSRPFAIGYVRAYANALGLEGETAAEIYKHEAPNESADLRAPIGVKHDRPERRPLFIGLAIAAVAAVVVWNIAQRVLTASDAPPPSPLPAAVAVEEAPVPQGPITLGAATPPPAEQTTPVPYVTPGLSLQPLPPPAGEAAPTATAEPAPPVPAPVRQLKPATVAAAPEPVFTPKGEIYGADASGPTVVLQARKAASLIVRGAGGEVYFARQLVAGESYRAPIGQKLSADVTDPSAFSVYINDQLRGVLTVEQTPLDRVVSEIAARSPTE
jgi:cytoskeletal protein RodZ